MRSNIRYVLLCAMRDKLFVGLLAGVIIAAILSAIIGSTAFLEEKEMTLSLTAASVRFILITGLIVFVCFHIRSSFESREMDVMLSRPVSRARLVLDYWAGFAMIAFFLVVPTVAIIAGMGGAKSPAFFFWAISLLLESWIVVAVGLFSALVLRSAVSAVMTSLGFYVLARIMIYFLLTAQSTNIAGQMVWLRYILEATSVLMPRLDLFAKSEWLIYGLKSVNDWKLFLLQAVIYIPLLLIASIIDFRRKEF